MHALVNADRQAEGLAPVEPDEVATSAAQRHVEDMVKRGYRSHWGADGSVPEQRYTEAGGEHLVHENVTCFVDAEERALATNPLFLPQEIEEAQQVYMAERPPNDGHRLNILIPTHNLLGVGLAKAEGLPQVCVAQEFVDAYGEYEPLPKTARPGARIMVAGRVHEPAVFGGVGLARGELPGELHPTHLNSTSTYGMPVPYATYFPKGFVTPRPVTVEGGRFSIELVLDRGPGRYSVSVWGRFPERAKSESELGMLSLRTIIVR